VRTYSAADSDSIRPQDGCGSGMPSPRKDNEASVRIAEPSCAVASTMTGATVLGRMWRTATRRSLIPCAFAASTNGISRKASVLARMTRATCGMTGIDMAMIVFSRDGPSEAAITSAITSSGNACMMSIMRWVTRSNQPRRKPDRVEPTPTASEMRAPWMIRLSMSRPMKSAPSRCSSVGGDSDDRALVDVGSYMEMLLAKMAASTKMMTTTRPNAPSGYRRMR